MAKHKEDAPPNAIPPPTSEYASFLELQLRAVATGLGVAFDDLISDPPHRDAGPAVIKKRRRERHLKRYARNRRR